MGFSWGFARWRAVLVLAILGVLVEVGRRAFLDGGTYPPRRERLPRR